MEEILKKHASTIEEALSFLGIDPIASRTSSPNQWAVRKINSGVLVFIILRTIKTPNGLQVMMYALSELQEVTPEQNTGEFYHQLLLMKNLVV